jgi:hypothetical protein
MMEFLPLLLKNGNEPFGIPYGSDGCAIIFSGWGKNVSERWDIQSENWIVT